MELSDDHQSNTTDNLGFIQDLLFHMVDHGIHTYEVPRCGVPIDFLCAKPMTTRFEKVQKVLNAYSEDTGRPDRWRLRLLDDQTGGEYYFHFRPHETDAAFLHIDMEIKAPPAQPI